ncbi:MAG: ATP synthase F0 subunit B [Desulfobulbus sp.]|jgi:F-type H+-transporting ATPase subunit b|nr:ATP synthase F0 subunit B [Desulfobulbus sp.]
MRERTAKFVQPVLLALLIGVLPVVAVATTEPLVPATSPEIMTAPAATGQTLVAAEHGVVADVNHGEVYSSPLAAEKLKDLFWRAVNFIALIIILVKFGAKPIMAGLTGRQQQVKEELGDLTRRRDEAERSYKDFQVRLAGMEKEMERIVEMAIAQAQVEKERILAEAERVAEDVKRQAQAAVQTELEDAKHLLRDEVAEQAAAMAEELIVRSLTPADQIAITEQYLERVGAVQ